MNVMNVCLLLVAQLLSNVYVVPLDEMSALPETEEHTLVRSGNMKDVLDRFVCSIPCR
jgi:hypothetical protein